MPGSPDPGNTRTSYRYDLDTNTNFVRSRSRTSGPAIKGSDVLLFRTSSSSSSQTVTRSPRDLGPTRAPKLLTCTALVRSLLYQYIVSIIDRFVSVK